MLFNTHLLSPPLPFINEGMRDPAKGKTVGKERIGLKVLSKSFGGLKVKALLWRSRYGSSILSRGMGTRIKGKDNGKGKGSERVTAQKPKAEIV